MTHEHEVGLGALIRHAGGPLEGLVIVEFTRTLAGEISGGLLSDLGATVVKVEPATGSPTRNQGEAPPGEDSLYFQTENRSKYAVVAEASDFEPGGWLEGLLAEADALIEDYGPTAAETAWLERPDLAARLPRLCVLRISPFGHTGPLSGVRGDDRIAQAYSGAQYATGFPDRPPVPVTLPIAACWTAINGANALLFSIFHVRSGGPGQVVDLALYETLLRLQEGVITRYDRTGTIAERAGIDNPGVSPSGIYRTRDGGWIALSGAGEQPFARLCAAIGSPEVATDPKFATTAERIKNRAAIDAIVGEWIGRNDLAHVEALFAEMGVTGTAVRSVDEIVADEHIRIRGSLVSIASQDAARFEAPSPIPRFSRTPHPNPARAPRVGEHTDAVRAAAMTIGDVRPHEGDRAGLPLEGVRILDLSQFLAGPAATAMLADFGAEVIMIDLPVEDSARPRAIGNVVTNRNKRSISLDVSTEKGREAFLALVRISDVVVENFRPGTLERWDLAPERLLKENPSLVVLRASGFGQTGPYSPRAAFNPVGLAYGGLTYLNGWADRSPVRDGVQAGDYTTALFNVLGVMSALLERMHSGQGQVVDVAMYEAILRMTGDLVPVKAFLGVRRERAGGQWPGHEISLTAEARDGRYVTLSAASWDEVATTFEGLGLQGGAFSEGPGWFEGYVKQRDSADAVDTLRRAGLAACVVNSVAELMGEEHVWSRSNLVRVTHPDLGELVSQGVTPSLSRTPGKLRYWAPYSGCDTASILGGLLGYDDDRIKEASKPRSASRAP